MKMDKLQIKKGKRIFLFKSIEKWYTSTIKLSLKINKFQRVVSLKEKSMDFSAIISFYFIKEKGRFKGFQVVNCKQGFNITYRS